MILCYCISVSLLKNFIKKDNIERYTTDTHHVCHSDGSEGFYTHGMWWRKFETDLKNPPKKVTIQDPQARLAIDIVYFLRELEDTITRHKRIAETPDDTLVHGYADEIYTSGNCGFTPFAMRKSGALIVPIDNNRNHVWPLVYDRVLDCSFLYDIEGFHNAGYPVQHMAVLEEDSKMMREWKYGAFRFQLAGAPKIDVEKILEREERLMDFNSRQIDDFVLRESISLDL